MTTIDQGASEAPEQTVDVTILVVNWNTRHLLRACIESIAATTRDLAIETIVVDNGSSDDSAEMLSAEFPWVSLIANEENVGWAPANNQGMVVARGRYVLLLNSDAEIRANAVRRMAAFLDRYPRVGVVGGMLVNPDGSFQFSHAPFPTVWSEIPGLLGVAPLLFGPHHPSRPYRESLRSCKAGWVNGAFMMARRSAIQEVGLLAEDFFMYSEEVDWCFRFHERGWMVCYVPEAVAVHHVGGSAHRVPERRRWQIYRAKWLLLQKHRPAWQARLFLMLLRLCSAGKLAGWSTLAATVGGARRQRAHEHVRSYQHLIERLAGC